MFSGHKLLKGAMILTGAGLISRIMGFFFRIFLSHAFGEESVGLYQLIFPVYSLCLSISTGGIQTAVSRSVARKISQKKEGEARTILGAALLITLFVSLAEILVIQKNADQIAVSFLGDARCAELLLIISYALPCAAIHSCICGYSFGLQDTRLPAVSQLIEQGCRILFVLIIFLIVRNSGNPPVIQLAVAGITAGEFASALFSGHALKKQRRSLFHARPVSLLRASGELMSMALPLTASRAAVTFLQSVEAASIPAGLKLYGLTSSEALAVYGVLTGMALPCILFPSAATNSVGTVLLPAVSASSASGDRRSVAALLKKAAGSCLVIGLACCLFFLLTGSLIGNLVFHSETAGKFILTLAWICPFLYTNTALLSTINGLGKAASTFFINVTGLLVRIASVFLAIPRFGMQGYLWGLLASQLTVTVLAVLVLYTGAGSSRVRTPSETL